MAELNARSPRPRPVDLLFGEDVELKPKPTAPEPEVRASQTPGYLVEPPRPVTSLRPPPPEFPTEWRVVVPPEPAVVVTPEPQPLLETPADTVAPPPKPPLADVPVAPPLVEATTFTVREPPVAPAPEPAPVLVPPSAPAPAPMPYPLVGAPPPEPTPPPLYGQSELLELSQFVDQLYQNVADETSDSAALNAECLANLRTARAAIEQGEYARAEAAAEAVKSRLLRARASRAASSAPATRLLFVWLLVAALGAIVIFAIPAVFRIVPAVIPLLRGLALGLLGGAAMALWQVSQNIVRRELDAASTRSYALSPLFGALSGAALYLLSLLGILAAPHALGITAEPFLLMYLFALLAGLFNDVIVGAVRGAAMALRRKT